jgi:hypothetical protein
MKSKKHLGDRLEVKASAFLGSPAAMGTIVEVCDFGYQVHIDGDDPEWFGPVDVDGNVLLESPSGFVRAS